MSKSCWRVLLTCLLGLSSALAILVLLGHIGGVAVRAQGPDGYSTYYVAPGGDCGGMTPCFSSVQAAVDAVDEPGEMVKVAAGVFTDIYVREDTIQMVYISKTVTVCGGYTLTNWSDPDPQAHLTILDAQGQGRVFYVVGPISATIKGLRITHGDATKAELEPSGNMTGGGLYVADTTVELCENEIINNTAFNGGGLWANNSTLILHENEIISNNGLYGGGGAYLKETRATLSRNQVLSNTVSSGTGGGVLLVDGYDVLFENTIAWNESGSGGGINLWSSSMGMAFIYSNTIVANVAGYGGGGISVNYENAMIYDNIISSNTAFYGGGIYFVLGQATISRNRIFFNQAWYGGGISGLENQAVLDGNWVILNSASFQGGGLYLSRDTTRLVNNVFARNAAPTGSGLFLISVSTTLLHTTLAQNTGGDGSGLYVTDFSEDPSHIEMVNTILVSHTVGVTVTANSVVTMEATLWGDGEWSNQRNWDGAGTLITGSVNLWQQPGFVDPTENDYHLSSDSAAWEMGVPAGIDHDLDGEIRPMGWLPDIGADERSEAGIQLDIQLDRTFVNIDQPLTCTIAVTSAGTQSVSGAVLTHTVSPWERVVSVFADPFTCSVADAGWGGHVVCQPGTMAVGSKATITVTTEISAAAPMGQRITHAAAVTANETKNGATVEAFVQDCHARINDVQIDYVSVQEAIDAAQPGDLVKVAGTCVGVTAPGGQLAYIDKTLTLQGGYTATNWQTPDWIENPTTLNALGQGRVIYSDAGDTAISPTVEGLIITGGNVSGYGGGGGILVSTYGQTILRNNRIMGNMAYQGGGISANSNTIMIANVIISNTAYMGGGLLWRSSVLPVEPSWLINSVIADNYAESGGSGMYIQGGIHHLVHNTIARNQGGDGSGIYATFNPDIGASIFMTDTILVSHTTGIYLPYDFIYFGASSLSMEATLWGAGEWANLTDIDGVGTVVTGTPEHNYWADPVFVAPDAGDYRIRANSPARDAGVDAGVDQDIEGDARPAGDGYDLGADEFVAKPALAVWGQAAPNPVQAGEALTLTLYVTNTGNVDLNLAISNTLPQHVTPTGTLTWTPTLSAYGQGWTQQVTVVVNEHYGGPLNNIIHATAIQGAAGMYTVTAQAWTDRYLVYLPVVLRAYQK